MDVPHSCGDHHLLYKVYGQDPEWYPEHDAASAGLSHSQRAPFCFHLFPQASEKTEIVIYQIRALFF